MTGVRLIAYRIFVLLLGIWTGSGVYDSLYGHVAWWADPVGWVRTPPVPGAINPWPFTTGLLLLSVLAMLALVARRQDERRIALPTLLGVLAILVVTFAYFVPTLVRLFGGGERLTEAEITSISQTWIVLNAVRIVVLIGLFYAALVALGRRPRL